MLVLANVRKLYDGSSAEGGAVHAGVDLALDGGLIVSLQPHDPSVRADGGRAVVDASGWTVTPGLVDAHGHVTALGLGGADMDRMNGASGIVLVEKILHASLVEGGVTTMRDVGGATHLFKRLVDDGTLIGPRLAISICMLSTTGGHADFRGPDRCHAELSRLWPPGPGRPASIVDGPWECRKRVREIAACGADLIKICASPGVASPSDHLEHRDFTAEEIAVICDEAAARGLPVAAHAHSRSGLELAIDHGVSDLQHISFLDERLAGRAAEKELCVTPTSWVTDALQYAEGLSDFVKQKVAQVAEHHRAAVQAAHAAGLKILAGTDPVLPGMHGRNYMEIVHLARDGLTALEAWHAGTGLAAREIGHGDTGTLRAGQRADLLVWESDVVASPDALESAPLLEVVKDGVGYRGHLTDLPQRDFATTVREALAPEGGGER